MKIKAAELQRALSKSRPGLIWVAGDEPLLLAEAADLVRTQYRTANFLEREILNVDKGFDWENFLQASNNLSLFADNRIIELRMKSSKPEDAGKKALQRYVSEADGSVLVLITSPRIDKPTHKTKWFQAIEADSLLVEVWPIDRRGMGMWLEQRLLREGIRAEAEALQLLVDRTEGNLLAAMQEITKLKLLAGDKSDAAINLDANTVNRLIADNARYNAFQAVDAALEGDVGRTVKILQGLRAEGVHPLVVLGAATRELRTLITMLEKRQQGQAVNAILQSHRVFQSRRPLVGRALQRLRISQLWQLLEQARVVDQSIKGMTASDSWLELSLLLTRLAGKEPLTPTAA